MALEQTHQEGFFLLTMQLLSFYLLLSVSLEAVVYKRRKALYVYPPLV